jgi:V/A-type H+-transporting ATPase subunit E
MPDKGVEKIISHIEDDAEKEISEILRKARAEADAITKTAREKATRESERILSNGRRIASLEGQKIIAEARIDVRRKRMDVQEKAITTSFEAAKKALEELAEKGKWNDLVYKDVMFSLVSSASEIVAGNKLELVFNQKDSKTFSKEMLEELNAFVKNKIGREISLALSDDIIQCIGGVLVRDLDNHVEVDQTLETKLKRLRESLRIDVAKILFGDRI